MSVHWISEVWRHSPYRGVGLLLHLALADTAHEDGRFFASQAHLARSARCSVEKVRLHLAQMQEDGLLVVLEPGRGRGHATVYQLRSSRELSTAPETPNSVGESLEVQPPNSVGQPPNSVGQPPNSARYLPSFTSVLNIRPENTTDSFDHFWDIYPRHAAKKAARKSWEKAIRDTDPEIIIEGARRYRDDPNREDRYTAHAATWLNQERWCDDPLPPGRASGAEMYLAAAEQMAWPTVQEIGR